MKRFINLIGIMIACMFSLSLRAQVTIGANTTPDINAVLDLVSGSNKGLLLPRVALTATTSYAPLSAYTAGMVVYNTATAGDVTPGFYYCDGGKWVRVANGTAASGNAWQLGGNANGLMKSIGTTDNFSFPFITNNTERMRIDSLGRVGIGTTKPNALFHVRGVASSYPATGLLNVANDEASSINMVARIQANSTVGSGLTILANGNVGINRISPPEKLTINNGNFKVDYTFLSGMGCINDYYTRLFFGGGIKSNNDGTFTSYTDGTSTYWGAIKMDAALPSSDYVTAPGNIKFLTGATNGSTPTTYTNANLEDSVRMAIVGSRVGIGTTNPLNKLDVRGGVACRLSPTGGSIIMRAGSATQTGYLEIYKTDGSTRLGYIGSDNTNMFYQADNGANLFAGAAVNNGAYNAGTSNIINFSSSNIAHTNYQGTTYTLNNLINGGAYTLILTNASNSGTAVFTCPGLSVFYFGTTAMILNHYHIYSFIVANNCVFVTMATSN